MEEKVSAANSRLRPELECVCSGVHQTEEVRGTSVIRLITLVISPAVQVTRRSLRLPTRLERQQRWRLLSTLERRPHLAPAAFPPSSHLFFETLRLLHSRWKQIFRCGGLGPRGQWPKQTFPPPRVERESFFSASELCRRRREGSWGASFTPFIRCLPSCCLPGGSQTGAQFTVDLAFQRPKQGLPPAGRGE